MEGASLGTRVDTVTRSLRSASPNVHAVHRTSPLDHHHRQRPATPPGASLHSLALPSRPTSSRPFNIMSGFFGVLFMSVLLAAASFGIGILPLSFAFSSKPPLLFLLPKSYSDSLYAAILAPRDAQNPHSPGFPRSAPASSWAQL